MNGAEGKSRQLELVAAIRNVHEELRYKVQKDPDSYLKIWEEHNADPVRSKYASAMHSLATEVWASKSAGGDRIEIIGNVIMNYFMGGGLQKVFRRMHRKYSSISSAPEKVDRFGSFPENELKVLDVGSCYNPFARFKFDVTAIDLCPATQGVFQCDFINVPLGNEFVVSENCIKCLPSNYFHAVIFSLLLEYLPDSRLRLSAVHRAYRVLRDDGILVVVTPDSKHQQKNQDMVKSWRNALSQLGFDRISYAKHDHLHCLAFRKLCRISRTIMSLKNLCEHSFDEMCECCTDRLSPMLFIHQDKLDYLSKFEPDPIRERSSEEQEHDALMFNELPGS
ncbi:S-adenosylmethionine sensor upstream of mTORC1 [Galendromus occidentalis]|uniref:S-adenosylmethionine sensor upstream of mTORC1 n=1 Tax=Galendromus occidentalis TaxID=34638 RepID=A0AAJ7SFG6_9ACAR|nr:S-adenosylmethionine sensor upstream of mTORC1 [Galendromus occidentalis]